jgi:hypothetical protein
MTPEQEAQVLKPCVYKIRWVLLYGVMKLLSVISLHIPAV